MSSNADHRITLFSKDGCPLCPPTAISVGKLCAKYNIELLVKNVVTEEESQFPGFPCAFIPKELLKLDNDILMLGADMVPKLEYLILSGRKA